MEKKIITKNQSKEMDEVVIGLITKSSKIRALASKNYSRGDISRYLDIRYQHVRNVLITPLTSK